VDSANNLYIAGTNTVRKVTAGGVISTVAGNGVEAYSGDGGPAVNAGLSAIAIAVDSLGNLYIGDTFNHRVRKVSSGGTIATVAGTGANGYSGDSGPAGSAQLGANSGLAVDSAGNLYIADIWNLRIRQVSPAGIIATVAGNGSCCNYGGDGGPATAAQVNFFPWGGGMAADTEGNLFVADTGNSRVRKIASSGIITTIAGTGIINSYSDDGGPAINQSLNYPSRVAIDHYGNVYIADTGNLRVRKVGADGMISTVGTGAARGVAVDSAGNLYVAIGGNVSKISPTGEATTAFALGTDSLIFDLAIDRSDNLYLADIVSYRVFKASPDGVVTVVAGTGAAGDSGDGGPAANAKLNTPVALAIDRNGNLYIADTFNKRIRMVSPEGIITTVAGIGTAGYSGDGGPAVGAEFGLISGLTIDDEGNLYAADQTYNAIRMLQTAASSEQTGIGRHRR
jgi:sugar lactone lactonase YvrE